jgi:hypothetical protein
LRSGVARRRHRRLRFASYGLPLRRSARAHDTGLHGGFVSRADRERFFVTALFETQADEAGRVQGDDDAAEFRAVLHESATAVSGGWLTALW